MYSTDSPWSPTPIPNRTITVPARTPTGRPQPHPEPEPDDHKAHIKTCILRKGPEPPPQSPIGPQTTHQDIVNYGKSLKSNPNIGQPQSTHQDMYTTENTWTDTQTDDHEVHINMKTCILRKGPEPPPQSQTGWLQSTYQGMYTTDSPWSPTPIPNRTTTKFRSRHVYYGKSLNPHPDPQPPDVTVIVTSFRFNLS